jgi:hypothetical protein
LEARTVIVNTRQPDDRSVQGVLAHVHGDCLVLRHALYLATGVPPQRMDGDVVIPRDHVAFIQTVAPAATVAAPEAEA